MFAVVSNMGAKIGKQIMSVAKDFALSFSLFDMEGCLLDWNVGFAEEFPDALALLAPGMNALSMRRACLLPDRALDLSWVTTGLIPSPITYINNGRSIEVTQERSSKACILRLARVLGDAPGLHHSIPDDASELLRSSALQMSASALIRRTQEEDVLRSTREEAHALNRKLKSVLKFNESILLNSPLPIGVYASNGQCVEANDAYVQLVGATREALLAQNFYEIKAWKTSGLLDDCLSALAHNSPQRRVIQVMTSFGKEIFVEYHILPTSLNDENYLLIQFVDLTERVRAEVALHASEASLRTLLRTIPDLIWLKDANGVYISCNVMFERFFGATEANIVGKTDYDFVDKELADFFRQHDRNAMAAGKPTVNEEWINFADDGHRVMLETTKAPIYDASRQVIGVLGIGHDITERKRLEEELREHAFHDPLTQLPNRRLLLDRMEQAIYASKRQSSYVAVLYLDLNKFKQLNDTHGHDVGDKLLIEVAQRLKRTIRETDTVARLGGDEFVVLLEGLSAKSGQVETYVNFVADKIRHVLNEEYILGSIHYLGSASVGIKLVSENDEDPEQILKAADAAMYEEKSAGKLAC